MGCLHPEGSEVTPCKPTFITAAVLLVLSFIWFVMALHGLNEVPKCRYGEPECNFPTNQCVSQSIGALEPQPTDTTNPATASPFTTYCKYVFLKKAIEGSSDYSLEQLAVPIMTVLLSTVPPVIIFVGTLCTKMIGTLESSKFFLSGVAVLNIISIGIVDRLTFDCRWWKQHNDNQDKCKTAFNVFTAGAFFNCLTMIALLTITIIRSEEYRAGYGGLSDQQGGGGDTAREPEFGATFSENAEANMPRQPGQAVSMQ